MPGEKSTHLCAGIVLPQSIEGYQPIIAMSKEFGGNWRIREEIPYQRAQSETQASHEDEDSYLDQHDSIGRKVKGQQGIQEERLTLIRQDTRVDVPDTITQQRANDRRHGISDLVSNSAV